MRKMFSALKNRIWLCIITALAIGMGCVFAACATAQAESSDRFALSMLELAESTVGFDHAGDSPQAAEENYSRWLSDHYSSRTLTREIWLKDLLGVLELSDPTGMDTRAVFAAAHQSGIADNDPSQAYSVLTRRYAAQTLVKALDYDDKLTVEGVADLGEDDEDMAALVYYGYFIPDESGRVYPDAAITEDEYQALLEELRLYRRLQGKRVLAFGDSIMYGMGNHDRGISDMICEKYGMTALDSSVSGATFGVDSGRSHIPNQIKAAARLKLCPDVIMINGGTNDMSFVKRGDVVTGYDPMGVNERTFAGGFEYSAYLLQRYWKDIPVIYIRAHDMDTVDDSVEQEYGEMALTIAEKWHLECVDIYNDTEFCTEDDMIRDAYTAYKSKLGHSDGIHPTAIGYAKFYLPLIAEKLGEMFQ